MATCKECFHYVPCFSGGKSIWDNIEQTKDDHCKDFVPAADVVPVVRCKDCKYRNPDGYKCRRDNLWHDSDDFCSYGMTN